LCVDENVSGAAPQPGHGGGCVELIQLLDIDAVCCAGCHRRAGRSGLGPDEILHDRKSYFVCCEVAQRFWGRTRVNP
jgi:hypothetical protein